MTVQNRNDWSASGKKKKGDKNGGLYDSNRAPPKSIPK